MKHRFHPYFDGRVRSTQTPDPCNFTEGNELADRMAMLGAQSKEKELCLYRETMDIPTLLKLRAG